MWSEIIDPNTGDKVNIKSQQGIQILRNYLLEMKKISMRGGSASDGGSASKGQAVRVGLRPIQDKIMVYAPQEIMIRLKANKDMLGSYVELVYNDLIIRPNAEMAEMNQADWTRAVPHVISEGFGGASFFTAATRLTRDAVEIDAITEYITDSNLLLVIQSGLNIVGFALCTIYQDDKKIKLHVIGTKEREIRGELSGRNMIETLKQIASGFSKECECEWQIGLDAIIEVFGYYIKLGFAPKSPSVRRRTAEASVKALPGFAKELRKLENKDTDDTTMIKYFRNNSHLRFIPYPDTGFGKWVKNIIYGGIPMMLIISPTGDIVEGGDMDIDT